MIIGEIHQDSDCESPREWDNVGKLCLFHGRKKLPNESGMSAGALSEYLESDDFHGVSMPVFMYEHSGIALNTHGFTCPWDSGQVGVVYATPEKMIEAFPDAKNQDERIVRTYDVLVGEVEVFGKWLNGDCFGYVLKDSETGEQGDSCWGFIGSEDVEEAAKEAGAGKIVYRY